MHAHENAPARGATTTRPRIHLVGGTRPEAIKLAPLVSAVRSADRMEATVVSSGQHPTSFDQGLTPFDLTADVTLPIARVSGTQPELVSELTRALEKHFTGARPDAVVVQGDTTTALVTAMTAFLLRIPVAHLEAGLRTGNIDSPFPEEANRSQIARIASLHLAPTPRSVRNLTNEGIAEQAIECVGNTVVDAATDLAHRGTPDDYRDGRLSAVEQRVRTGLRRLVIATAHRRDSWGEPMDRILNSIATIVETHPDVEVVFPAHPNPAVAAQVHAALDPIERVTVTGPLDYPELMRLLSLSSLVCSDSGGIQEEAPTFGVPVLVMRDHTERVEAVDGGTAALVGTDEHAIVSWADDLLDGSRTLAQGANPFGDGAAALRSEQALSRLTGVTADRPAPFRPGEVTATMVISEKRTPLLESAG